jgi:hypothetical protein
MLFPFEDVTQTLDGASWDRRSLPAVVVIAVLLIPAPAAAQVRWDAGAQAGVSQRLMTGGSPGAPSPDPGPVVQLQAHLALLPMVRLGLYAAEDLSPAPDRVRSFSAGGLHVRITPPLLPTPWRTWLFAGFGFAEAYDGGTRATGQLFDVPGGLGLGAKLGRRTLLFGELGARFGLGFYGSLYRPPAPAVGSPAGAAPAGNSQGSALPYLGHDAVALSLTVGLSLDE